MFRSCYYCFFIRFLLRKSAYLLQEFPFSVIITNVITSQAFINFKYFTFRLIMLNCSNLSFRKLRNYLITTVIYWIEVEFNSCILYFHLQVSPYNTVLCAVDSPGSWNFCLFTFFLNLTCKNNIFSYANFPDYGWYRKRLERISRKLPPILNRERKNDLDRSRIQHKILFFKKILK